MEQIPQRIIEPVIRVDNSSFQRTYKRIRLLGKGGFAYCYEMEEEGTKKKFAIKILSKELLARFKGKRKLMQEIKIHKMAHHETIVHFYRVFEDSWYIYIVLELCEVSLSEIIKQRKQFTPPEIQYYIKNIGEGVKYLHSHHFMHRDLKLGNIFLNSRLEVKIGDFGLATKLQFQTDKRRSLCGTPNYLAPEIISSSIGHSYPVDIWALGVITYVLMLGFPPFQTSTIFQTYKKIRNFDYKFPNEEKLVPQAVALIKESLVAQENRPTIEEFLDSPFLVNSPLWLPRISMVRVPDITQLFYLPNPNKIQSSSTIMEQTFIGISPHQKKIEFPGVYVLDWIEIYQGVGFILSSGAYGFAKDKKRITKLKGQNIVESDYAEVIRYEQRQKVGSFGEWEEMIKLAKEKMLMVTQQESEVFVKHMMKIRQTIFFRLSNKVIQAVFADRRSIAIFNGLFYQLDRKQILQYGRIGSSSDKQHNNKLTAVLKVLKQANAKFRNRND